ncbi:MAG: hypothetical protein LAO19_02480 [Acidobacteriia bacterium]|nr:hypothetical protein [Terriglobia bacterium]
MSFALSMYSEISQELPLTTYEGIKRAGPPQAIQKLREDLYMVQITLSETPSADWKRLFYETQQAPPPDFPPRGVDLSANFARFRSDAASVEAKTAWIDRWIERANQKEAAMGGRLDQERKQRREDHAREQQELAAINTRWEKL